MQGSLVPYLPRRPLPPDSIESFAGLGHLQPSTAYLSTPASSSSPGLPLFAASWIHPEATPRASSTAAGPVPAPGSIVATAVRARSNPRTYSSLLSHHSSSSHPSLLLSSHSARSAASSSTVSLSSVTCADATMSSDEMLRYSLMALSSTTS